MKRINYREIDGYEIFISSGKRSVNPEATKTAVAKKAGCPIEAIYGLPNYLELYEQYEEYFDPTKGTQKDVEDPISDALEEHKAALEPNQLLTTSDEVIPSYLNVEYWKIANGKWEQRKIEHIGEKPDGILQDELTQEQQEEISNQQKEERLNLMTPEERKKLRIAEIKSRLIEIDQLDGLRPIREAVKDLSSSAGLDTSRMMLHEDEAITLREELDGLEN